MPDQTPSHPAPPADQQNPSGPDAPTKRPPGPTPPKPSRRPLLGTVAVALIAGALAGLAAGWLRPSAGASAHFTDQQSADAKKSVCAAAALARQAVAKNMHLKNPDPENPLAQLAVAANARLSLAGAAAYLRGDLADQPATPHDVAEGVSAMAAALEHLNVSFLAGQPNSDHEQVGRDLDARITELGKLCG